MKNFLPIIFFLCFLSCHNGNGTQKQKSLADSLANAVLKQQMDIRTLANSDHFMYFDEAYFQHSTDIKKLTGIEKIKAQVVSYRIYKNLSLENNRYVFKVKSALDLHIPNSIFVNFERAFIESNKKAANSNDSLLLQLPINFQDSVLTW
ncbi:hypothetical protein LZQ00_06765 [Sphingobacterium sp. SRCM116780]|uniref:hypothetical protein n=1 Tax=Sphingobacterium sp. SRCM116780 TaxID=2907623 RepID=UPI001F219FF2|nr:hypothetical protein [Sphingobacterium sp. SRCM116780]UIR57515.1 hypothetical protein LZQ00_06765 [Sphingobacterium sp. SRCM116780]